MDVTTKYECEIARLTFDLDVLIYNQAKLGAWYCASKKHNTKVYKLEWELNALEDNFARFLSVKSQIFDLLACEILED